MRTKILCLALIGLFVLIGCNGKPVHDATSSDTIRVENSPLKERITGRKLIQRLQKAYGLLDDLVSDPNCPAFLMGIYLDKGVPVIQVEGDTVLIRQELEEKLESDAFRLELTGGLVFSQKRLQMLQDEMSKRLSLPENAKINANVIGYGAGTHYLSVNLIVNTPERQKEFREKIIDSPVLEFKGKTGNELCTLIGTSDTLGISLEPESPVYPCHTQTVKFILHNNTGYVGTSAVSILYGEGYSLVYERDGQWFYVPINDNVIDIGYMLSPGEEGTFSASLYPDIHPNQPGRYRIFKDIRIGENREKVLLMAEFRLED